MALSFWNKFSTRTKRILSILFFFLLSIVLTTAGTLTPLTQSQAQDYRKELEQVRQNVTVQNIFGNNFMICLVMFVPIVGPVFGLYVLYNTGVFIAADAMTSSAPYPAPLGFFLLFIFPFTWLEFISYSTAFAESVWLIRRIFQHRGRKELVNACVLIAICAAMLLLAAVIEFGIISMIT